ncbi:MAG TPA: L,D-transpeptidase [Clostridiaceae bacterium]
MKITGKKYVVIGVAIIAITLSLPGLGYYKKVEAKKLETKFSESLKKSKYNEALISYNYANKDIIIKSFFSFSKVAKALVSDVSSSLQTDYLDYKLSFESFQKKENELSIFQFSDIAKLTQNQSEVAAIEVIRGQYNECIALYEKKEYATALASLAKLSDKDKKTNDKINTLKTNINKDFKASITNQIADVVKNEKFADGIILLNTNNLLFSDEEIATKTKEINQLVAAKAEEARLKAIEEGNKKQLAIQKEQALIASCLVGYTPSPDIENPFINIESGTSFLLNVDIKEQKTRVFTGKKGDWKLIKNISCSTGAPGYDTPTGTFKISARGDWFFSDVYNEGAEYWTRFFGDFLFHSLPMDKSRTVVDPTLGTPASHGCVRLPIEDAKWIYNNMSSGTKVIVN